MDVPLNPSAKGARAMTAYLTGIAFDKLQKERDQVLSATQEDIRRLAEHVKAVLEQNYFCVVGSEEKIKEQQQLFENVNVL